MQPTSTTYGNYVFEVNEARAHRNTISRDVRGSEVRGLKAFPADAGNADRLVAALRTMAMGDSNACEIAQESHLAIAHESGLLKPSTFLSPAALAPRGTIATGIVIDDCLTTCKDKVNRAPNVLKISPFIIS